MVFVSSFRRKSLASVASTACATCALQGRRLSASQCQHKNLPLTKDEESEDDTAGYCPPSSFFARSSISAAVNGRRPSVPEPSAIHASPGKKQYNAATVTGTGSPFSTITPSSSSSHRRPSLFQSWRNGRRRSSAQPQQQAPSSPSSIRHTSGHANVESGPTYLGTHLAVAGPSSPSSSSSHSSTWDGPRSGSRGTASPRIADTWIYAPHQWNLDGQKGSYQPQAPPSPQAVGLDIELQRQSPSPIRAHDVNDDDDDARSVVSMSLTEEIALYLPKNQATPSKPDAGFTWNLPVWNAPSTPYGEEVEDPHGPAAHLGMLQANESGFIDPHLRPEAGVQWNLPQWNEFAVDPFPTPRPRPRLDLPGESTGTLRLQAAAHQRRDGPPRLDETWRQETEESQMLTPRLIGGTLPSDHHLTRSPSSDSRRSEDSNLYSPTSALPPTPGTQLHFIPTTNQEDRRDSADSLHKQFCSVLLLDLGNGTTVPMSPSPSAHPRDNPLLHYAF